MMKVYTGCVEDRDDPLKLGRCRVRIVGLHSENKTLIPTEDLPWAYPMTPVTSAAMNGIGWTPVGPVPGTWVVIIFTDTDEQQPLMIGTLPGIPQTKAATIALEESDSNIVATNGGVLTDSSGKPVTAGDGTTPIQVGTQEASSGAPATAPSSTATTAPDLTAQKEPNKPSDSALKQPIPVNVPPGTTGDTAKKKQNIQYLIDACDQLGLTTKYAKAAILGICGGESSWLPIEEGYYYKSAEQLAKIFSRTFKSAAEAQAYTKWTGTAKDFFNKIYEPQGNGKLVGNKQADDGGKYYGRGFNQLTGRPGYDQTQKFLKKYGIDIDLMGSPDLLISDPKTAALACAAFYKMNVTHDINDPGYFGAALKRTGADAAGTGYEKKKKYYEYFLGEVVGGDPTNKPAADTQKTYTADQVKDLPPATQAALLEDRSSNAMIGFSDPSGKYPLRNLMDEPDTNRLARGIQKDTALEFKDSDRNKEIIAPNDVANWSQPLAPFGGTYPYSKVFESESGHLMVFDDTPTNEMISLYHRAGTFIDVDANGTMVQKIVGDGYYIIQRNGGIYVGGRCNITVGESCNLLVNGTADVQVDGQATVNLHHGADIGVHEDVNIAIGGNLNMQVGGNITMKSASKIGIQAASDITTKSGKGIYAEAKEDLGLKSNADFYVESQGNTNIFTAGDMFNQAAGAQNLLAAGNVNVQGSEFHGQEGSAAGAQSGVVVVKDRFTATDAVPPDENGQGGQDGTDLVPPEHHDYKEAATEFLTTPVRPSPPFVQKFQIEEENFAALEGYLANPDKFSNPDAAADGVKQNFPGTPKDDGNGKSLKSSDSASDIGIFLQKQLQLADSGYWRETGQSGKPSNPNILRIWEDLGFSGKTWESDQTAWCMGFVNWTLKQCGYRYVQSASAKEIANNTARWKATKVDIADADTGDIVLWSYSHVNFVYMKNGKMTFVGGNQSPSKGGNNPNDGDVTNSWPSGWSPSRGGIVGIFRPSKV